MGDRWKSIHFTRRTWRRKGQTQQQKSGTNQVGKMDSSIKACTAIRSGGDGTCASDVNGAGDLPFKPEQLHANSKIIFYDDVTTSRKQMLQACLRAFQSKKDDLCQQLCLLDDEIARCEMNIQTILSGDGEECWAKKADLIIEALKVSCSSKQIYPPVEERGPPQICEEGRTSKF